jgi:hypothetical protein
VAAPGGAGAAIPDVDARSDPVRTARRRPPLDDAQPDGRQLFDEARLLDEAQRLDD